MIQKKRKTNKGFFFPINPQKYLGDPQKIIFRSSWELSFFKWCDKTNSVLQWASEEFSIPYLSPLDGKVHQYFPDALVVYRDKYNVIQKEIIEIKPYKESVLRPGASEQDKLALIVNTAKWKAAAIFAEQNGCKLRVVTEKSMFSNGATRKKK